MPNIKNYPDKYEIFNFNDISMKILLKCSKISPNVRKHVRGFVSEENVIEWLYYYENDVPYFVENTNNKTFLRSLLRKYEVNSDIILAKSIDIQ